MKATNGTGLMTIGEVASSVDVATSTLRYYERAGLLRPAGRSRAGYRLYDASAVERLRFLRAAQAVGFTLEDIRTLLDLDADSPCRRVRALIERRLAEIDTKVADLRCVRATLISALERCLKSRKGCAVVADLRRQSKTAR